MIKSELHKLFKMKVLFIPLSFVLGTILYSMVVYGEFGYDLSNRPIAYSEKNGEFLSGQTGYEQNKAIATSYAGEVNDAFLERLHQNFNASSYAEINDTKFYNSTYSFFRDIFDVGSEHYAGKDAIWGNVDGVVLYGFTGDWDAYGHILGNFFKSFTVFILVFAAPLFAYERECGMSELLGTAKNGGNRLFKYKARAVFLVVNLLMFTTLAIISIFHFSNYGFANADVSIQCSFEKRFIGSVINCNMGQLAACQLLFGIVGCNVILLMAILVSLLSSTSLAGFSISFGATWVLCYPIVQSIVNDHTLNLFLSLLPVNALYITTLIREVSNWKVLRGVLIIQLILSVMMFLVTEKVWVTKLFYIKRD